MTSTGYTWLTELHTFLVLDIETCRHEGETHIVQVGIIKVADGYVETSAEDTFVTLINPQVPIDKHTQDVHHITDAMVANAPTFDQIINDLDDLLTKPNRVLVAHNSRFDIPHMKAEYERAGRAFPTLPLLDTMLLPDQLKHPMPDEARSLTAVAQAFSFERDDATAHDALADATLTARVLKALLQVAADSGIGQLSELLEKSGNVSTDSMRLPAPAKPSRRKPPVVTEKHLRTHRELPRKLTDKRAQSWVEDVVECSILGCGQIRAKAENAQPHAARLLKLLDKKAIHLLARDSDGNVVTKLRNGKPNPLAERWQVNTFLLAWSVVAKHGLNSRPAVTWWHKHRDAIRSLPTCEQGDPTAILCPACRRGTACLPDKFHQQIAFAALERVGQPIPKARSNALIAPNTSQLRQWVTKGSSDLAGFAAMTLIRDFERDGNITSASAVLDLARQLKLDFEEPRLALLSAEDWHVKDFFVERDLVYQEALKKHNTDPYFTELAIAYAVANAPAPEPKQLVRTQPWSSRPTNRVTRTRFKL